MIDANVPMRAVLALALTAVCGGGWVLAQAPPQEKARPMHRVGGARDGASAFPRVDYAQVKPRKPGEIDFSHFHTYDETVGLLKAWAAKYPDLVELYAVGQSRSEERRVGKECRSRWATDD